MKAAFGGFIEGLDVIYCNDLCADIAAERFDVAWVRTSPMVMSVRDDIFGTVLSGESSFCFGRTAYGDSDDVRSFYFACSASFSPIEHYVAHALFPNNGNNGSATVGLGFILDSGGEIEIVQDGDLTLIPEVGSNDKVLVFDSSTGLLRDQIITYFSGAYCYSDQQTEWGCDFGWNILDAKDDIWDFVFNNSFMDGWNNEVLGIAGSVSMSVGMACLPAFPVGTLVGLGLIGFGLYSTYYADDLNRGVTDQRLAHFGLDVGLSLVPGVGSELKMGKIILTKGTKEVSSKIVAKNSFAFEKYLVEKGESEILYGGLERHSQKFNILESAYYSRYGYSIKDRILKMALDEVDSKFYHLGIDMVYYN